jgi:hypothetical protein
MLKVTKNTRIYCQLNQYLLLTRYFNVMVWGFCYLGIFKKMHQWT